MGKTKLVGCIVGVLLRVRVDQHSCENQPHKFAGSILGQHMVKFIFDQHSHEHHPKKWWANSWTREFPISGRAGLVGPGWLAAWRLPDGLALVGWPGLAWPGLAGWLMGASWDLRRPTSWHHQHHSRGKGLCLGHCSFAKFLRPVGDGGKGDQPLNTEAMASSTDHRSFEPLGADFVLSHSDAVP